MAKYGDPYALHLTHARAPGEAILLRHPGSSWGFGALLKGLTSVAVLKVEESAGYSLQNQNGLIIETV